MNNNHSSVPAIIMAHLKSRRMTQVALAKRLRVTPQYISQITGGDRTPTTENVKAIETALSLAPGTLERAISPFGRPHNRAVSLASMPGVEIAYLGVAMAALREARRVIHSQTPADALRRAQGKNDTRLFDAAAEKAIVDRLRSFNERCAIFTEEANQIGRREFANRTSYFIDPFDRSNRFEAILEGAHTKGFKYVGDVLLDPTNPMTGTNAPFGSITCIRDEQIAFNVMMDYCSGETYVACKAMLKHGNIDACPDPETLAADGEDTRFESREGRDFACYLGRADGQTERDRNKRKQYEKHLADLEFQPGRLPLDNLQDPGGPARILLLADDTVLGPKVACILSNGEKICEWFGWLAYVAHSQELTAYELYAGTISGREEILLAPPPNYSMFKITEKRECKLKLEQILVLDCPVQYRSAIVVAHIGSGDVITDMRAMRCRELDLHSKTT